MIGFSMYKLLFKRAGSKTFYFGQKKGPLNLWILKDLAEKLYEKFIKFFQIRLFNVHRNQIPVHPGN